MNGTRNGIVNTFIILLAIAPAFALSKGNMNMLLVSAMCLSPYFMFRYPIVVGKIDFPLVILGLIMITFPMLLHPETLRWSTILYSCLFFIYFMSYVRVLYNSDYKIEAFNKILKLLICAYCIVLMIQQFCVLTGLPIFNVSNYSSLTPWKLNSLTSEPSHSGRIVPILMYFYILSQEVCLKGKYILKERYKEDKWVWMAFLWTVLTMGSATAFIFLLIILLKLYHSVNKISLAILVLPFVAAVTFLFFPMKGDEKKGNINRAIDFITAVMTLDETKIIKADGSGAHRVVQSLRGAKFVGLTTIDDWMGHGVDADARLIPNWQSSYLSGGAGAFYLWVNFGFLVIALWWVFSLSMCFIKSDPWVSTFIWFIAVFILGGLNNQILWLVIVLSHTYKFLINKEILRDNMLACPHR